MTISGVPDPVSGDLPTCNLLNCESLGSVLFVCIQLQFRLDFANRLLRYGSVSNNVSNHVYSI